jgi:hypothetical protein
MLLVKKGGQKLQRFIHNKVPRDRFPAIEKKIAADSQIFIFFKICESVAKKG